MNPDTAFNIVEFVLRETVIKGKRDRFKPELNSLTITFDVNVSRLWPI